MLDPKTDSATKEGIEYKIVSAPLELSNFGRKVERLRKLVLSLQCKLAELRPNSDRDPPPNGEPLT